MMTERSELYAMYEVTKTYLLAQPGMDMKQPTLKPIKIAQPTARLLTDDAANLKEAQAKDSRKAATIKKKKTTALVGPNWQRIGCYGYGRWGRCR
jgi:hypothetical protein